MTVPGLLLLALAACTPPPPVVTAEAPPPPSPPDRSTESLSIAFPPAGARLSAEALAKLDGAARLYRDARPEVMIVSGHADKVGAEYPNLLLSAQRASNVKRALVQRGVPPERLQIIAVGSAEPSPTVTPSREVVVTWR